MTFKRPFKSKFKAVRVTNDGRSFMSKGESACYSFLKLRESQGEISDLKCQVTVRLTKAELRYVLDFSFIENSILTYCDYKGFETERWLILKKLWPFYGPGPLVIYKGQGIRMYVHEVIKNPLVDETRGPT